MRKIIMDRKIKLIWDFRGPESLKIARHHEIHLQEFREQDVLREWKLTGVEELSDMQASAFWVVPEKEIRRLRDSLKPHRAVVYSE